MWARQFDRCRRCGTTADRHRAKGLCTRCYQREIETRHKSHQRGLKVAAQLLTKQYLIEEYLRKKKSPSDIARVCGCTRQYIYKKMAEYRIPLRNKQSSRRIALDNQKIISKWTDNSGQDHATLHRRITYNRKFFRTWSSEMAYVLGVIYTDGCLSIRKRISKSATKRVPHLSLAQKEPELLRKVLSLMDCTATVHFRKKKKYGNKVAGELYHFDFVCTPIYPDLLKLGLSTKKSLDIEFPDVPEDYVRHFIRGCWDGDGSIYIEKRTGKICASFVSGSRKFVEGILEALEKSGLPKRTMYVRRGKTPSYYFRFCGKQCLDLCHFLYDDVPSTQYLERKHAVFRQFSKAHEKGMQTSLFRHT